jgi:hypothetical protein
MKARTTVLVLHKAGGVEINCPRCSKGVLVPLAPVPGVMLKKAADAPAPRFVVRRT